MPQRSACTPVWSRPDAKTLDEVPEEYRAEVQQNLLDQWF